MCPRHVSIMSSWGLGLRLILNGWGAMGRTNYGMNIGKFWTRLFTTFHSLIFKNNTIFGKPTTSSFHWFLFHLSISISSEDIAKSEKNVYTRLSNIDLGWVLDVKKGKFWTRPFTTFPSLIFKNNTIFGKPRTSSFHWILLHLSISISLEDIAKSEKNELWKKTQVQCDTALRPTQPTESSGRGGM